MWQVRKMKDDIIGAMIGAIVATLIGSYAYSQVKFVDIQENPEGIFIVKQGEVFDYCRKVTYIKDSNASLDKAVIKYEDGKQMIIIDFATRNIFREAGFSQKICKRLEITDKMETGNWVIETYLTRKQIPFWSNTVKLKDVYIQIVKGE